MELTDEILAMALSFAPSDDQTVLRTLCRAAQCRLAKRLKDGVTTEDCTDSFVAACAMTAAGEYLAAMQDGVSSFTVGDVRVEQKSSQALLEQARLLLQPYCKSNFSFMGVRT